MKTPCLWLAAAILAASTACLQADASNKLKISLDPVTTATPTPPEATPTPRPPAPTVVPFEKLIAFLPKAPEGWSAEKPNGSVTDVEVFNLSTATQTYQKGEDEMAQVVTVTIIDAGGHNGYLKAITSGWKAASTPEGTDKLVQIDGLQGFEHISLMPKAVSLAVIVGNRYFVQIDLTNMESKDSRDWLKKMDLKGLAELK
jgi:hypothetical protein